MKKEETTKLNYGLNDDKTCILDVKILLNNDKRLNIELQTTNYGNWTDRSLLYLYHAFDDLHAGQDYSELKTTIHIGILDFTLFPDAPEFYSEYLLMNTQSHKIYDSKFAIRVLELNQVDNVSEEEKQTDLYYWAKLFNARNWEEIAMLAEKSETIKEAAATVKKLNADEKIILQCEAREKYERDMLSAIHTGEKRGKKEGRQEGRILEVYASVQEGDYGLKRGAEKLGISVEELKKQMEEAGYRIP